jgi:isoleucyl-tRNA synthetase
VLEAMVRWLAPILSFTAEEIWRHMPGERPESVFSRPGPSCRRRGGRDHGRLGRCSSVRAAVLRELERLRVAGAIGAPLDAVVDVYAEPACAPRWRRWARNCASC